MTKYYQAAKLLKEADNVVLLTGAGMSVDSGLPDYRGKDGQWGQEEKAEKRSVFEIMNPQNVFRHPTEMWLKFAKNMIKYNQIVPHEGYHLLKQLFEKDHKNYFILTSNVDSQFYKSGFQINRIYEMHGSYSQLQCSTPCCDDVYENDLDLSILEERIKKTNYPACPKCGAMSRPNVYMFRDRTFITARVHRQRDLYEQFLHELEGETVAIEIGSGPHVQSIRRRTRELGSKYGATIVRINPKDFQVKAPHLSIHDTALNGIKKIMKEFNLL